jgi:hypothetical protein
LIYFKIIVDYKFEFFTTFKLPAFRRRFVGEFEVEGEDEESSEVDVEDKGEGVVTMLYEEEEGVLLAVFGLQLI